MKKPQTKPKPLYILPKKNTSIKLDGPAVAIQQEGQAEQLIPLGRIQSIVLNPKCQVDTNLQVLCVKKNIPVQMMDNKGHFVYQLIGKNKKISPLGQQLGTLFQDIQTTLQFTRWCKEKERESITANSDEYKLLKQTRLKHLRKMFKGSLLKDYGPKIKPHIKQCEQLLEAEWRNIFHNMGVDSRYVKYLKEPINMPSRMKDIHRWMILSKFIKTLKDDPTPVLRKRYIQVYQQHRTTITSQIETLVLQLDRYIVNLEDE